MRCFDEPKAAADVASMRAVTRGAEVVLVDNRPLPMDAQN
jgi:hypothetical protein